ncbi:MAG: UDP-3-O-(3-hydroxymyristoyl)glucosamine N-acyltransferase, partial [Pseudomonadota bacterium]
MTHYTIEKLALAIGGTPVGDASFVVSGAAEPQSAAPDQLAIATHPKFVDRLADGGAQSALLADGTDWQSLNLTAAILVTRPKLGMAYMSQLMDLRWRNKTAGISPHAVIDPSAQIGSGATIGAFSVIETGVVIGDNAWIGPSVSIGADTQIGADATLLARVAVGPAVHIGDQFIAHPGSVIGADGFSFVTPDVSGVEKAR